MISANSRYSDSTLITAQNRDGQNVLCITPGEQTSYTFNYIYYTTVINDRVDKIAYAFYGDVSAWYRIGDANPEILDWSEITPGTLIRIPSAT